MDWGAVGLARPWHGHDLLSAGAIGLALAAAMLNGCSGRSNPQFETFQAICVETAAERAGIRKAAESSGFGRAGPGQLVKHDGGATISVSYADGFMAAGAVLPAVNVRSCALLAGPGDAGAADALARWLKAPPPKKGQVASYYVMTEGKQFSLVPHDEAALREALASGRLRLLQSMWTAPDTLMLFYGDPSTIVP